MATPDAGISVLSGNGFGMVPAEWISFAAWMDLYQKVIWIR